MKKLILAAALSLPISVNATGIPVVDALRNAIATMEFSEAIVQTGHMIKDAASQATQIANQTTQIFHLVNQFKALTEGDLGPLLEGMAMDELYAFAPELATAIEVFGGGGTFSRYGDALETVAGLVDTDEMFGEVSAMAEAAIAIKEAYGASRGEIGRTYGSARYTYDMIPNRNQLLSKMALQIRHTRNVTQATNLNTQVLTQVGGSVNEIARLQALQLEQESRILAEQEAQEARTRAQLLSARKELL